MPPSDRDPDARPLLAVEVWQLVLVVVGLLVLAAHFVLGAPLPKLGMRNLLVLLLLVVLAGLLVLRARRNAS